VIGLLEGIGTAILFLAINYSEGDILVVATGILTAAVLSGKLTGAHFNSALTIAVFIVEGFEKMRGNLKLGLVMIVSQFIGGYIGSLYALLELGKDDIAVVKPADPDNTSPLTVFLIELFFTFILICCILHNIYPRLSI
jgi:glycerol uptake facilitator-like aquaporin